MSYLAFETLHLLIKKSLAQVHVVPGGTISFSKGEEQGKSSEKTRPSWFSSQETIIKIDSRTGEATALKVACLVARNAQNPDIGWCNRSLEGQQ